MQSIKRIGYLGGASAVAGTALVACAACCAPLIAPLLAWLGIAGLALMGPYGLLAAAVGAMTLGVVLVMRRRRRRQCLSTASAPSSCQAGCFQTPYVQGDPARISLPAPIACTLSTADFKERARWLDELKTRSVIGHRLDVLSVHLSYRIDAADDVEKMVRQEQACCGFLRFDLGRTDTTLELTVTAPAEAGIDAHLLFAHLVPD